MKKKKRTKRSQKSHWFPLAFFAISCLLFIGTVSSFYLILHTAGLLPGPVHAQNGYISWRVFDGGVDDSGSNTSESYVTTSNVSGLKVLWKASLPATADDSVVEEAGVSTGAGYQNMVFVNTIKGNLLAFNALTGAKIWEADPSSADFNGQGTKSSPAIDPSGSYVYAYAVDGYVHKYNIATGAEVTGNGFPAQITLLPNDTEKGSSSLNIANGYLYMTISGNDGDYGHYVGHVVAINLATGAKTVWNAECSNITQLLYTSGSNYCSNTMAGIWARPGVKVDPITGNVFFVTGNGNYNANSGGNNWGDSIIEMNPNLTSMIDSYTPTTYSNLDSSDADLGSSAPVILPTQSESNTPYMLVQGGKDNTLRLINRSNMSGQGGPRHTGGELHSYSISSQMHEQPAVWQDSSGTTWVFVTDDSGDLYAYKVVTSGGASSLSLTYQKYLGVSSSPFIANGVMYFDGSNILAINPTTGAQLFNSSSIGVNLNQHWEAPTIVNGMLYTSDNNGDLYALYVPGVTPTSAPTSPGSISTSGGSSGISPIGSTKTSSVAKSTSSSTNTATQKQPTATSAAKTTEKSSTGSTNSITTAREATPKAATTVKSPSILARASSPLFVASASAATLVAAGVAVKILALKGIISSSTLTSYTAVPAGITGKLRLLLARLLQK